MQHSNQEYYSILDILYTKQRGTRCAWKYSSDIDDRDRCPFFSLLYSPHLQFYTAELGSLRPPYQQRMHGQASPELLFSGSSCPQICQQVQFSECSLTCFNHKETIQRRPAFCSAHPCSSGLGNSHVQSSSGRLEKTAGSRRWQTLLSGWLFANRKSVYKQRNCVSGYPAPRFKYKIELS